MIYGTQITHGSPKARKREWFIYAGHTADSMSRGTEVVFMKIEQLASKIGGNILNVGAEVSIENFYIGDLLSHVIATMDGENCAWLTIMNNVNVVGTAVMTECKVIVLCQNQQPSDDFIDKAKANDISVITTVLDLFSAARAILS